MSAPARTVILGSMRKALGGLAPAPAPAPSAHPTSESSNAAAIALFETRLRAAGGNVSRAGTQEAMAEEVQRLLRQVNARLLFISDAPILDTIRQRCTGSSFVDPSSRESQLAADAGITSANLGIAETGTLVLVSGGESHRLPSLLPPVHIAILEAEAIVATFGDALERLRRDSGGVPSAITLITGPSRTADIELTLVVGVHGPRALHVIILERNLETTKCPESENR